MARPQLAELRRPAAPAASKSTPAPNPNAGVLSPELAAALAAVVTRTQAAAPTPVTTPSFVTAAQKEAVIREEKRRSRRRVAKFVAMAAAIVVVAHVAVTQVFHRVPTAEAVQNHAAQLPARLLPLYSTARQPLQLGTVTVSAPEVINGNELRYVAHVTLRLRQPLYLPAASNGTIAYRQVQVSLQAARDQELRYNLFSAANAPAVPSMPLLLQTSHRAGEPIVVKVAFTARRFGWEWKLGDPQLDRRSASGSFEGNGIEFYSSAPYLIFGGTRTLAEIRHRTKLAQDYVLAVTKEVQRLAGGRAVEEVLPDVALAEAAAEPSVANLPAFDPYAPAIELPAEATAPAIAAPVAESGQ